MASLPIDWLESPTVPLHGVTRSERLGAYIVVIMLNKKQIHFGPFRDSRLEAIVAHDRLLKYFLPFAKGKPTPNCSAEVFLEYTDFETEELYGEKKLKDRFERLKRQSEILGYNIEKEREARLAYIRKHCGLHSETDRMLASRDRARRKAFIRLEATALQGPPAIDLTGLVRELAIPRERWSQFLSGRHDFVNARFADAQEALVQYIRELKEALDLDPDKSTR